MITTYDNLPHAGGNGLATIVKKLMSMLIMGATIMSLSACSVIEKAEQKNNDQIEVLRTVSQRIGASSAQCPEEYGQERYIMNGAGGFTSIRDNVNTADAAFTGTGRYCMFVMPDGDVIKTRMYYINDEYIIVDEDTNKQL